MKVMRKYGWLVLLPFIIASQYEPLMILPKAKVEKLHCFSNPHLVDTFKLFYNTLEQNDTITFQIISSTGELIFHEKFLIRALFDDLMPTYNYMHGKRWKTEDYYKNVTDSVHITDSLKVADRQYLLLTINNFFDEKKFHNNPIPELHSRTPELLIKGSYGDLMNDQTTIGFVFNLYEENIRGIAFSKEKKKVVVYYACC